MVEQSIVNDEAPFRNKLVVSQLILTCIIQLASDIKI